ncbi:hypothetical protein CLI75_08950 [Porphyromonas gingivalis]|nr:hypothetical protein [Porphyromonas gingivalis]ATS06953.1 hypothetical protein CS387_08290 [Porphyromonas gingivalis]PDP56081.1 hypothetical protein CLI75_08950 [Porphyromonas gingivalis]PDP64243.1 hypothetical protein CLI80_05470 [Porphyromonas gingivalis]
MRSKIFVFVTSKNVARKLFRFGVESEKFTRHNEKNLVPFSRKTQTAIGRFLARGWPEIGSPKRG